MLGIENLGNIESTRKGDGCKLFIIPSHESSAIGASPACYLLFSIIVIILLIKKHYNSKASPGCKKFFISTILIAM